MDVPVGVIHSSWGGSSVQAWMSQEVLTPYQKVELAGKDITKGTNRIPTALYNAMIHPITSYTIKGALWYQGESNRNEADLYKKLFPAMVQDWRQQWGIGDFPFYYTQIAPFEYNDVNSAWIREVQLQCLDVIPNTGLAVTMDIGEKKCIHPAKKKEVAERLLFNALHYTYNMDVVDPMGPVYDTLNINGNKVTLTFRHAEDGLYVKGDSICGLEIAGDDQVFYPAQGRIKNRKELVVWSDQVPNPVAVRYGWTNWIEGCLFDTNLLPASSFRTDSWSE